MELSFPAQQRHTWAALKNVSWGVVLEIAPNSIHVWMEVCCRHLFTLWQGRQATAWSPSYNPDTGKAHWAADGSQMSAAPMGHMLLLESSALMRIMTSASCCHLKNHCLGYSHWTWFAVHHGRSFPSAGRAGSTDTASILDYAMFSFTFCTTCPLRIYSRLLVVAGRVTNCIRTPVLRALSCLSGHLVGAPPGLQPGMCAQQRPSRCDPGACITWD